MSLLSMVDTYVRRQREQRGERLVWLQRGAIVTDHRVFGGWVEVLESCLPTDEGYDDDTEQVLRNVIESMRRAANSQPVPRP